MVLTSAASASGFLSLLRPTVGLALMGPLRLRVVSGPEYAFELEPG